MKQPNQRSPLKGRPLRLPGQSVEEAREKLLDDVLEQWGLQAIFFVVLAGLEWYRYYMEMKLNPWIFTAVAIAMVVFAAWRIARIRPELRNLRQATDGERIVGQFLERLREHGYQVFHDVIGEGFNIDHVLIGPAGVLSIETKTWSKPARGTAEIEFDGVQIRVGNLTPDRNPVVQAKAQANWVRNLLQESTGKQTFVRPVVVFPGWFVSSASGAYKEVWVLEPKALPSFLQREPVRLSDTDVRLFGSHLSRAIRSKENAAI